MNSFERKLFRLLHLEVTNRPFHPVHLNYICKIIFFRLFSMSHKSIKSTRKVIYSLFQDVLHKRFVIITVQHLLITLVSGSSRSCPLRIYTGTNFENSARVEAGFFDEMARNNAYAINCAVTVSIRG